MADIGLTQEQIDAMLSGAASGVPESKMLSASEAQSFADFERDTMGNFPSVINAMTGFTYQLSKVDVTNTTQEEIVALAGSDLTFKIPIDLDGEQYSFLILDSAFAKQTSLALTGAEAGTESDLSEVERSALSEVIDQGAGSYLSSLGRALKQQIEPAGACSLVDNAQLADLVQADSLVASLMLDDGAGNSAHLLHIVPPQLARLILQELRAIAPVAPSPLPPVQQASSGQQQPASTDSVATSVAQAAPAQTSSRKVLDSAATEYAPARFGQLGTVPAATDVRNLDMLLDVPLQITVELGKTSVPIRQILEYGQGSLITLDKLAGEPIDMLVNGRYFARAEVVVIDENFGVRITSILSPAERLGPAK